MSDRLYILDDLKKQVIDLPNSKFVAPNVGLNDEPVRYYRANEQWASIFEGLLGWLTEVTAWADVQDENDSAIQATLEFIQGIEIDNIGNLPEGAIVTTKEELCEAFVCGWEVIAGRIVSGQGGNIVSSVTIDKDTGGIVISASDDNDSEPIDATSKEVKFGGVSRIETKYKEFIKDILDYHSDGISQASAEVRLSSKYLTTDFLANNLGDIWTNLSSEPDKLSLMPNGIAEYLYCSGATINGLASFIIDEVDTAKVDIHLKANQILDQTQIDLWYKDGKAIPRDGYQSSACYRMPNETVLFDVDLLTVDQNVYFSSQQMLSAPRDWRFEFSGSVTNANGDVWDGLYLVQNGVETYTPPTIRRDPALTLGLVSTPNYNPAHVYSVQTDDNTSALHRIDYVGYSNGTLVDEFRSVGGLSGQVQVTKIDLGVS